MRLLAWPSDGNVPYGPDKHTIVPHNNYSEHGPPNGKHFPLDARRAGADGRFSRIGFRWLASRHACAALKASFWAFESHREPRHVESSVSSPRNAFRGFGISCPELSRATHEGHCVCLYGIVSSNRVTWLVWPWLAPDSRFSRRRVAIRRKGPRSNLVETSWVI